MFGALQRFEGRDLKLHRYIPSSRGAFGVGIVTLGRASHASIGIGAIASSRLGAPEIILGFVDAIDIETRFNKGRIPSLRREVCPGYSACWPARNIASPCTKRQI